MPPCKPRCELCSNTAALSVVTTASPGFTARLDTSKKKGGAQWAVQSDICVGGTCDKVAETFSLESPIRTQGHAPCQQQGGGLSGYWPLAREAIADLAIVKAGKSLPIRFDGMMQLNALPPAGTRRFTRHPECRGFEAFGGNYSHGLPPVDKRKRHL